MKKIIVLQFFLDFLWIFKIRKIHTTVVHGRVTRRVGRVGLWRQLRKAFRLERWWEREQTADQRSQRDCSKEKNTLAYRCLIGVLLQIALMWWISLNVYLSTTYLPLAIKQPFHENTTGQVGTTQATVSQEYALMETVIIFIDLVITSHISLELANTVWLKLETCVISRFFGCQPLWFHSVIVFLFVDTR